MTLYNITEAKHVDKTKDIKIELLQKEIDKLNDINKDLFDNCARDTENALILQKKELNEKHKIKIKYTSTDPADLSSKGKIKPEGEITQPAPTKTSSDVDGIFLTHINQGGCTGNLARMWQMRGGTNHFLT